METRGQKTTCSRRLTKGVGLLLACSGLWVGCAAQQAAVEKTEKPEAPAVQASRRTVEITPEKVEAGKALFSTTCIACHGPEGVGRTGTGPRLNSASFLAAASDDFLIQTITRGRAGTTMIGWGSAYSPEQIESIVAYLRSLNDVQPAQLDESPLKGDVAEGEKIFSGICAGCHGNSGAGYQETANGTGIGRAAFLSVASNGYLRYIIKHGKDQTMMRPFDPKSRVAVANLSDDQIEDVIAYLRANAW